MADEIHIRQSGPEAARADIERTRARMSETIDEIEDVLVRKKEELRDRLDIVARIRERPLKAAAIALAAGLLLGFLSGGRKQGSQADRERLTTEERAARWEARARRLLAIAREQEEDLEELEDAVGDLLNAGYALDEPDDDDDDDEDDDEDEEEGPSRWGEARGALGERVGRLASSARRGVGELRRGR